MTENRREFFRVLFEQFINGEISRKGEGSIPVKIDNLSMGGAGFISDAELSMGQTVTCSFNVLESSFVIDGFIVRKQRRINYFEYGVTFEIDQETSSELFKQLNYYQIRQRRGHFKD